MSVLIPATIVLVLAGLGTAWVLFFLKAVESDERNTESKP